MPFCSLGLRVKLECPVVLMYRRHLLSSSCSLLRHKEVTQDSQSSNLKSHFMNISPWKVTCGPEPWTGGPLGKHWAWLTAQGLSCAICGLCETLYWQHLPSFGAGWR